MTETQIEIIRALRNTSIMQGTFDKRFVNSLAAMLQNYKNELSEKQNEWMFRLLYKYRKQNPGLYMKHCESTYCCKAGEKPVRPVKIQITNKRTGKTKKIRIPDKNQIWLF